MCSRPEMVGICCVANNDELCPSHGVDNRSAYYVHTRNYEFARTEF